MDNHDTLGASRMTDGGKCRRCGKPFRKTWWIAPLLGECACESELTFGAEPGAAPSQEPSQSISWGLSNLPPEQMTAKRIQKALQDSAKGAPLVGHAIAGRDNGDDLREDPTEHFLGGTSEGETKAAGTNLPIIPKGSPGPASPKALPMVDQSSRAWPCPECAKRNNPACLHKYHTEPAAPAKAAEPLTNTGVPSFPAGIEGYRELCAELYQVAGVLWAEGLVPRLVMDKLSAGQRGLPIPQESLLPFDLPSAPSAPEPSGEQLDIDISNLRFYAQMAEEYAWDTGTIHYSVITQTLKEIADRLAALRSHRQTGPRSCPKCGGHVCQPYKSTETGLWTQRCDKCEWFDSWAGLPAPAVAEKKERE